MLNLVQYDIRPNDQYPDSNEVYFESRPSADVISALKALRMRWNPRKGCWYGFKTVEEIEAAINGETAPAVADTPARTRAPRERKPVAPKQKTNKFGIKVGDIFEAVWGYDTTIYSFFQVVALVGESSVRVREVSLSGDVKSSYGGTTSYVSKIDRTKLLPADRSSVFIKDQTNGDVKRVRNGWGGVPTINVGHQTATLISGDTFEWTHDYFGR